jgi:hypothetical protein
MSVGPDPTNREPTIPSRRRRLFRGPRLLIWLTVWAILILISITTATVATRGSKPVGFAILGGGLLMLIFLAKQAGSPKASLILILAGTGLGLQAFAVASLFSELRVERKATKDAGVIALVQALSLTAQQQQNKPIDLRTAQGRQQVDARLSRAELMSLLDTGQILQIRNSLTPDSFDIFLFAIGSMVGFGAAAVDGLPDNALPKNLRTAGSQRKHKESRISGNWVASYSTEDTNE